MKITRTQIFLIAVIVFGVVGQSAAQNEYNLVREVFEPVLPDLRAKTSAPLRLPTYLGIKDDGLESFPLYAIIEKATRSSYFLQIAFSSDCSGGTVCRWGGVTGTKIGIKTRRPRGRPVKLARGISGFFEDSTCGANCSDSVLTWDQGGYRYTVESKAGALDFLKKVANSAIAYTAPIGNPGKTTCFMEVYTGLETASTPVVNDVSAKAVNIETKQVFNSISRDGVPVLARLPEGEYDITASKPGLEIAFEKQIVECSASTRELSTRIPLWLDVSDKNSPLKVVFVGVLNYGVDVGMPPAVYPKGYDTTKVPGPVVQVLVDENGRVIAAKAGSGDPKLFPAAEKAARTARINVRELFKTPRKFVGLIIVHEWVFGSR